jgi:hypothetical protein
VNTDEPRGALTRYAKELDRLRVALDLAYGLGTANNASLPAVGPWGRLTVDVWPIKRKSINWPPPISLSTVVGVTHYGHFRTRFKNETGHELVTLRPKAPRSPHSW